MKKLILSLAMVCLGLASYAQQWAPVGENIKTQWAETIDPNNPHPEYPPNAATNIPQSNCLKSAICQPPLGKGGLGWCIHATKRQIGI